MTSAIAPAESHIVSRIRIVRDQKVMLDADLADLYGVPTGVLVQAVKRNLRRFPRDFMFQLTEQDVRRLKSQSVILASMALRYWGRRREIVASKADLAKKLDELERRVSGHDEAIIGIVRAIRELAAPPGEKQKNRIGF